MNTPALRCARCDYILADSPPPLRCPECGHKQSQRQQWLDGELHLEGPVFVLPIFLRFLVATGLLIAAGVLWLCMSNFLLESVGISMRIDNEWRIIPLAVVAPVIACICTRAIGARGADNFRLQRGSLWRRWIAPMQLVWWLFVVLRIVDLVKTNNAPVVGAAAAAPVASGLFVATVFVGLLAHISWIVLLRHLGRIGEYLRDPQIARLVLVWTWLWFAGVVLLPIFAIFANHYDSSFDGSVFLGSMLTFSNLGFLFGMVVMTTLLWRISDCLAYAHETVDRDHRRASKESDRYRTPK